MSEVFRSNVIAHGSVDARGGLYSRGVPVIGPILSKGNVYHVDSGHANASDTNTGRNPSRPLATLDAAVGKCTADNGDLILVAEGHAETLLTAAALNLDVAGVTVIGCGNGSQRPTLTMGATATGASTAATVAIGAVNVTLYNVLFVVGIDAIVKVIDVNTDDCLIEHCEFREASGKQAVTYIDVTSAANGADRLVVRHCTFTSPAVGATQAIELGEVNDGVVIEDNYIYGDWSTAGIHNPIGKVLTNLLLKRNVIANLNTGSHAIELVSACTGMAIDNRMYGDTLGTILDPGSLLCAGNLETDAIDQAGVDSPRTAAGALGIGAIGAASFAAGAIDAAAIANGAIDASAIATDAIDADALAADAVAEIADGVYDEVLSGHVTAGTAGNRLYWQDQVSSLAAAALPQTAASTLFTVAGGSILMKSIVGTITVQIGAFANATKLKVDPTGAGATTDICATVELNAAAVGTRYSITGTFANAGLLTVDVPVAKQATELVIPPGVIQVDCAGNDGGAGRIRWAMLWQPLEAGVTVT